MHGGGVNKLEIKGADTRMFQGVDLILLIET
jgi:hypothetical protein